jgi:type IV secretion system protein VirD4
MGVVTDTIKRSVFGGALAKSRLSAWWPKSDSQLPHARYSHLHELSPLLTPSIDTVGTGLLLGTGPFHSTARVRPTTTRRELGNVLVCAPPRAGKSLHAVSQLLTWPHSVIVNDLKGELHSATAEYRSTLGPVYVFDHQGFGHAYDPLAGKDTEDELLALATHLLFQLHEAAGKIFTDRAIEMLLLMWLAARHEGIALFPYTRFLIGLGLEGTAARLQSVSPHLATQFLLTDFHTANFDDRFLLSCWGTLTARLRPILTETVVRSLTHSDFTPEALLCGKRPVTVYIRWKEQHLKALAPLVRLLWSSFTDELTALYDQKAKEGQEATCRPVLLLIDEGGRTAIPNLDEATSTVCGRGISLWLVVQSLEQLAAVYGQDRADIIRGNCETQLYYRPNDLTTARYLEERLGTAVVSARSETLRDGQAASEGRSERQTPLLPRQDAFLLDDTDVIAFHRNLRPLKLTRMDWRDYPTLAKRHASKAPPVAKLPPITAPHMRTAPRVTATSLAPDDEELVNPEEIATRRARS